MGLNKMVFWNDSRSLFKKTGHLKDSSLARRNTRYLRKRFKRVSVLLKKEYKNPRHGNVSEPFGEIMYILLSSQTNEKNFSRTWKALKNKYPKWQEIESARLSEISSTISSGGLANIKARCIKDIAAKISRDFGSTKKLSFLRHQSNMEIENYLTGLNGIKIKSARCVMMYSFNRKVFPVDTNIFRIFKRMGVLPKKTKERSIRVHNLLQNMVSPEERYNLHVNLVAHGRAICKPQNPLCEECVIRDFCDKWPRNILNRFPASF